MSEGSLACGQQTCLETVVNILRGQFDGSHVDIIPYVPGPSDAALPAGAKPVCDACRRQPPKWRLRVVRGLPSTSRPIAAPSPDPLAIPPPGVTYEDPTGSPSAPPSPS